MMLVVCCRCGKKLGEHEGEGISHGLCPVCARVDEEKFFNGHEYEALSPGRDDYATHVCRHCGVLVEISQDGRMDEVPGQCSGKFGVYSYVIARTRRPDRSLDDSDLGFSWNKVKYE